MKEDFVCVVLIQYCMENTYFPNIISECDWLIDASGRKNPGISFIYRIDIPA